MTNQTFHPNGKLAYTQTWAEYDEKTMGRFPDSSVVKHNSDGVMRIRVGICGKYDVDGSIIWEFEYDNLGKRLSFKKKPEYIIPRTT